MDANKQSKQVSLEPHFTSPGVFFFPLHFKIHRRSVKKHWLLPLNSPPWNSPAAAGFLNERQTRDAGMAHHWSKRRIQRGAEPQSATSWHWTTGGGEEAGEEKLQMSEEENQKRRGWRERERGSCWETFPLHPVSIRWKEYQRARRRRRCGLCLSLWEVGLKWRKKEKNVRDEGEGREVWVKSPWSDLTEDKQNKSAWHEKFGRSKSFDWRRRSVKSHEPLWQKKPV